MGDQDPGPSVVPATYHAGDLEVISGGLWPHMHKKVQVARRSTVLTWLALAAELEARAILHTSGKMNLEVVGTCEASRTRAS